MDESAQNELAHRDPLYHRFIRYHSFENTKRNTYKVFVTGVPVNIHLNLARSWATTLLARVALMYDMSSVARHVKLNDTPIPDKLRLVEHDAVPFHTGQDTTAEGV